MPKHVTVVEDTFLTDTHDLYVIAETSEDTFEIYHINLDSQNPLLEGPILKYGFD
jgi:hypothetical protein